MMSGRDDSAGKDARGIELQEAEEEREDDERAVLLLSVSEHDRDELRKRLAALLRGVRFRRALREVQLTVEPGRA